jgi:DNA-binding response OmpR family regulator
MRILIADDDKDFLDVIAYALRRAGFVVQAVADGVEALEAMSREEPDVVLLDAQMPKASGVQVCEAIRESSQTPIVLLGRNQRESEIIRGFAAGADDYVVKPVGAQHLVMRLQAIVKRCNARNTELTPRHLVVSPLVIDLDSFDAKYDGQTLSLTRLEFRLLYCLAANLGRVVSTARLIDFGWGLDGEGDVSILKTHFSHIRSKLRQASDVPFEISALAGAGYRLHLPMDNSSTSSTFRPEMPPDGMLAEVVEVAS